MPSPEAQTTAPSTVLMRAKKQSDQRTAINHVTIVPLPGRRCSSRQTYDWTRSSVRATLLTVIGCCPYEPILVTTAVPGGRRWLKLLGPL